MKYLIGIVLIGLLASCGDATGDASNNSSSSNNNSSGLIQIDDNSTQLTLEQMKPPKCSEIDGWEVPHFGRAVGVEAEELGPVAEEVSADGTIETDEPEPKNSAKERLKNYTGIMKSCGGDGLIREIYTYKNGKRNGIWRKYDNGGRLEEEFVGNLENGEKNGVFREWFGNGQLRNYWSYKNGAHHGIHKQWDKDGKLVAEVTYKNGVRVD